MYSIKHLITLPQSYIIITAALLLLYAVWIIVTAVKYYRLPAVDPKEPEHKKTFCIVIPVRNESRHIIALLESISAAIRHAHAEIIVIDDHSTDSTYTLCWDFFSKYPIGRILALKDFIEDGTPVNSYKKKAIEVAVRHTSADWIIQTDGDCTVPADWISLIETVTEQDNINYVSGPVRLVSASQSASAYLLHAFQALDFMTMQGITMAGFYKDQGQMSNGANLGYTRKAYQEVDGFENIDKIASGDDMLLLDKIRRQTDGRTAFIKSRDAIVDTYIVYSVRELLQQRIRWGSKSKHYNNNSLKAQLGLVYLVNLMIFLLPVVSLFSSLHWKWTFIFILLKTLIELVLVIPMSSFFGQRHFLPLFPILQPFHILYVVWVGFVSMSGSYRWKGRTVR